MKVVILAGGFGSRISEESKVRPKPLVEIGDKPILWHIMKIYSYYGFNEFVICLGYKGRMIKEYFYQLRLNDSDLTFDYSKGFSMDIHRSNTDPWKITLVDTGEGTMTGGRIKRIEDYLDDDDLFMFTYGDGVSNINIKELIDFHKNHGKIATVTAVKPIGRFGVMKLKGDLVEEFKEKVANEEEWINAGFFIADKRIFNYIKGDDTILEQEPLKNLAIDGELEAFKHRGFWQPMDTLKEKNQLEELWKNNKAPWKLW